MKFIKPVLQSAAYACKVFQANPIGARLVCTLVLAILATLVILAGLTTFRWVLLLR